jgi:hypothetical protein
MIHSLPVGVFFVLIPSAQEERAMNKWQLIIGVWVILTWTATTSSFVMGQDAHSQHGTHPVGALERVFQAKVSFPDEIRPGEIFTIDIYIQDDKGQKVAAFDIFQEKLMHLIVVSDDLAFFSHLHPVHQGSGHFQTTAILPSAGAYTLFSDYKPAGEKEQVSVLKLRMKGTDKSSGVTDIKITEKIIQDIRVRMSFSLKTLKANEDTIITFDLKQLSDGKPVTGLKPYLGEKGHLVVIRQSVPLTDKDYIHAHAMKGGEASMITFTTRFPDTGLYKLWCQFNSKGRILTADYWVNIEW